MKEGSGWTIERVEKLTLKSYSYEPMGASSYIPTPMSIIGKSAIINVQNTEDHRCFEYSVIASQYPAKDHPEPSFIHSSNDFHIIFLLSSNISS